MLVSQNGTACSESHFHLNDDNEIINNFTENSVGLLSHKNESNNYLCVDSSCVDIKDESKPKTIKRKNPFEKEPTFTSKMYNWLFRI